MLKSTTVYPAALRKCPYGAIMRSQNPISPGDEAINDRHSKMSDFFMMNSKDSTVVVATTYHGGIPVFFCQDSYFKISNK